MQTKTITIPLEVKNLKTKEFEGYGSVFGNKDLGDDIVVEGAFSKSLAIHKENGTLPMMFWMHNPSQVPGKWLEMSEDSSGLYTKGVLADTPLGNEIHTLLGMKAVSGLSIGYIPKEVDFRNDGVRLIKEAELMETSIVSIPMNPKAQIAHAKSRLSERGEYVPTESELAELKRDCEQFLRSKGFSKNLSVKYVSNLFITGATPEEQEPIDNGATLDDEIKAELALKNYKERKILESLNEFREKIRNG